MSELYTAEGTDLPEPRSALESPELSKGEVVGEPEEPEPFEDVPELPDDDADSELPDEPDEPDDLAEDTTELPEADAEEPDEPDEPELPDEPETLDEPEAPDEVSDEVRLAQAEAEGQEIGDAHGVQVDYTTHPIAPDSANDVNQAMEKLSAEYPGVFQDLEVVQSEAAGADSTLAYAVLEPGGEDAVGIYLDSGDFGDYEALSEQGKLEEESNWTVPGGGSVEGIFHHEFGHHCAQRIFDSPEANQELETVVSDAIGQPYDTGVEPHDDETAAAIESLVSEYGATDPHEMVAECFTEYKLADSPRPFAVEVGQIIDKYLKDTKE
ncbi:hypothetical protein Q5762_30030 [Streptomyces sp. P9(2023)]|uniref:hypothetical protein n=1 Tax=Streptomyces sp. P9(2023) TaxID=3064394 RepID=UPI0028F3E666|nr:hypothetical protein [Streptomyces sp. P9(2023)]MDT9692494.1 hypothetical protein [Streptomyces sp. P9(2023)]